MKVLQINVTWKQGSTGAITAAIHRMLREKGHGSVVLYGRGPKSDEAGVYRVCPPWYARAQGLRARVTGLKYGGCLLSTARVKRIIARERPDVVHLQCINGNFVNNWRLVGWLKARGTPTVLTLHGEFPYTANCSHGENCDRWLTGCGHCPRRKRAAGGLFDRTAVAWRRMARAFSGFEGRCAAVSLSPWQAARAARAPVLKDCRHITLPNGVDCGAFRLREDLPRGGTVLHVTPRFTLAEQDNKGGRFVAELARRMPHITVAVAGPYDSGLALPPNVKLLGPVTDREEMSRRYGAADVTLLTSFRETYSMVCAESLCCGTPVAGFCAGGPESLFSEYGARFVPYGDTDALAAAVEEWLAHPPRREAVAAAARECWGQDRMTARYLKLYEEMCHET